jgi:amino acid efflux transporter
LTQPTKRPPIGVVRGAALYVGALIGPGLLLIPALGVAVAGPASIVAWAGLLVLSVPLAVTFAALGARYPEAGGVSTYVRAGLGEAASVIVGGWFLGSILLGAPAVSLMGGYYVADLTGSSSTLAVIVAAAIFGGVLATNALGVRVSSTAQLVLSSVLVAVLVVSIAFAFPHAEIGRWVPFAPHGWLAIGTATNILVWLFVGWEAVAQLAGEFRRPSIDLPRSMALAFAIVTCLYLALAVATISIGGAASSHVPLADLVALGFGHAGRIATAVLAVALTAGCMNVYIASGVKLAGALADAGGMPAWLGRDGSFRPLVFLAVIDLVLLAALVAGLMNLTDLIRASSSLFVGIYLLAVVSAIRILDGRARLAAVAATAMVVVVAVFSSWYLVVCLVVGGLALLQWAYPRRDAIFRPNRQPSNTNSSSPSART